MSSITSDEHDIPAQKFLREGTKTNEEERTNGKNLPGISAKPIQSVDDVAEVLLWHSWVRGNSVDETFFLEP